MRTVDWRFVRTRVRPALLAVPLLWAAFVVRYWDLELEPGKYTDAHAYFFAAEDVRTGGDGYYVLPPEGPHIVGGYPYYLYPPVLAALLAPTRLSAVAVYRLVLVAGALGLLGLAWVAARFAGGGVGWTLAGWGLLLGVPWTSFFVKNGNIHAAIDGMAALGLVLPAGGALLALGAAIKVTPVWALGVGMVRDRSVRRWAVAGFAAAGLVTVSVMGFGRALDASVLWATRIAPTLSQGQFGPENLSPTFAPLQLLLSPGPLPPWARVYLSITQLGIPALVIYRTRRLPWQVQAGWALVAATLAAPLIRPGYFAILLLVPGLRARGRAAAAGTGTA